MNWIKRGPIYRPSGQLDWARSHAMVPVPWLKSPGVLRVFVGFCDAQMRSRVGWVDLSSRQPRDVLGVSSRPALDLGEPGAFDDNGVVPISVVEHGSELRLYYVGFQRGVHVPYFIFSGLAVSTDGGETFTRVQRTPILDRCPGETTWRTAPQVLLHEGQWRCWYCAGSEWENVEGKLAPRLEIRSLSSPDGLDWSEPSRLCLSPLLENGEFALARPWVVPGSPWQMLYAIRSRGRPYLLGVAQSPDGLRWLRNDAHVGIALSDHGWDSEMFYAPSVFKSGATTLLFYNGNGTGQSGFGYAELA